MKISPWPWNLAFLECTCFWPGRWTLLIELGNWTHKQFSGWISPHPRLQERKQRKNNSWKTQLWHRSMGRPRKALSSSTSAGKSQRKMKVPGAGGILGRHPKGLPRQDLLLSLLLQLLCFCDSFGGKIQLFGICYGYCRVAGWSLCPNQVVKTLRIHKSSKIPDSILVSPPPMCASRTLSTPFDSFFLCGDSERKYTFCLSLNATTFQRK